MAKASLVERDVDDGVKLLRELDKDRLDITAAFWFLQPETSQWLLILGTRLADVEGARSVYRRIGRVLERRLRGIGITLQDVTIISPSAPIINVLRSAIGTPPDAIAKIRFSRNIINGVLIEDALIYRLAL